MIDLSTLEDIESYRRLFLDPVFWQPVVQHVLQRHDLEVSLPLETGVPGTCPTFLVGRRYVVKFFGRLFDGGQSFLVEKEANRIAASDPALPLAQVLATGSLGGAGWPWPYLITKYIPGQSTGTLAAQLARTDWLQIAAEMGKITRRLHALPLDGSPVFHADGRDWRAFVQAQRASCTSNHRAWGTLPRRLVAQIDDFLLPVDALSGRAHLIHADVTSDHLLGHLVAGHWETLALIDFGDAMVGDVYYELAALFLDLLGADKHLLRVLLDSYGFSVAARAALPRRALAAALLHRFNVLANLPRAALQAPTLGELARITWAMDTPTVEEKTLSG